MNGLNLTARNMLEKLLKGRVVSTVFPVTATDIAARVRATGSFYLQTTKGSTTFTRDDLD